MNEIETEPSPGVAFNDVGAAGALASATNELVITRFVPPAETATKMPCAYVTEYQEFDSAAV